ncbi:hypothetical protein BDF14DRAFT_1940026 [Spinellus fusiger]|nr:hypothetical protein BDF14DRAFT_1940026 [Spinellus fusiger]
MHDPKKDKPKDYLLGLHWAATTGNVGLVKFALDHGAPIDAVVNGFMPLQLACISDNNMAVAQYLIDRGAGVNAQRRNRWSKKHTADKSQAVAGAIGSTALHVACANGCAKIVDLLLRNGAKVNVKDKYGSRPMDIAAAKHHTEIVKLLDIFGSMQQFQPPDERRSMDVASGQDRSERLRRPSLPAILEGKSQRPTVPPLSTLPPLSTQEHPIRKDTCPTDSIAHTSPSPAKTPELASSKSSEESASDTLSETPSREPGHDAGGWRGESRPKTSMEGRPDWYGYGVVNHYEDDNYLASLERRAYGLGNDPYERAGRTSLDHSRPRTSVEGSVSLKRCSSDGGHLRTTALMNAMAANAQQEEPQPRSSMATEEGPEAEAFGQSHEKELKKAWWSALGGRKSMEAATHQSRTSMEGSRKSLDFRPSFESLSQLAKKGVEGLSRKSTDYYEEPVCMEDLQAIHLARKNSRAGFLSRWVGAWSKK